MCEQDWVKAVFLITQYCANVQAYAAACRTVTLLPKEFCFKAYFMVFLNLTLSISSK